MTFPIHLIAAALVLAAFPAAARAADSAPAPATSNMRGDQRVWINDPHIHAFYALTVAAFANGPDKLDRTRYEHDAMEIFRDFGRSTGVGADAMAEHLKLIPGQTAQIATEDPKVLASYDNFIAALLGPQ